MRSRAHVQAHPIHPALVPFPFAFLAGAVLFDLAALATGRTALGTTGAHLILAGIAAGLAAAVPGVIDYVGSVPPQSSAKTRATRHAIGNVAALALFGVAFALRTDGWDPTWSAAAVELVAGAVLLYSGSLGGTLVTRNLISVDHRYAGAGKWSERSITAREGEPVVVGHADDLKADQMTLLHVNGRRLVLARTAGGYRAFDDRCSHRGASLAGGVLIDGVVQCLWHGSQFDVQTGAVRCGPARDAIRSWPVERRADGSLVLAWPPG
jgi:nitrite reductase/ring-hydroxylating ferredoxin subunit/uncharacterized membrane protein